MMEHRSESNIRKQRLRLLGQTGFEEIKRSMDDLFEADFWNRHRKTADPHGMLDWRSSHHKTSSNKRCSRE